tara:strand:+ start:267 stop:497 length:231 start_codon:yes stop_codon:yes gene_type:complete
MVLVLVEILGCRVAVSGLMGAIGLDLNGIEFGHNFDFVPMYLAFFLSDKSWFLILALSSLVDGSVGRGGTIESFGY